MKLRDEEKGREGQWVVAGETVLGKEIIQIKSIPIYLISSKEFVPLCMPGCGQHSSFTNDNKKKSASGCSALFCESDPSKQQPCGSY